jgi:hypothetical protein
LVRFLADDLFERAMEIAEFQRVFPETRLASLIAARAASLPYIAVNAWTATRLTSSFALIRAHL